MDVSSTQSKSFSKSIGIIGGAGPMASALLYTSIIEVCQRQYRANNYNDFPEIILVSYPFTRGNANKIREEIVLCMSKLEKAGADFFCIASNSFHGFLPAALKSGFVHLVAECLKEAISQHISNALILGAETTIDLKLYETSSIHCIYPSSEEQQVVNQLIREVAGGCIEAARAEELQALVAQIHNHSPFDGVIIACTEIPWLHRKLALSDTLPVVDTVAVLAKRLVDLAHS